jgi:UDP-2,3-diacylglucosamine pyrophosphatase LpxH
MGATDRQDHLADESHAVRYRAIFVSDLHLGTRAAQTDSFLEFLRHYDADVIYLVGDIIDFWRVKRGPVWLQSHNDVLQKLLRKVRKGARIVYIPGNHDEAMRDYCGMRFGGIEIHRDIVHRAADGRQYLVMHGDEFDVVVRYAKWLAFLGDRSYEFALWCNAPLNWLRRKFGFGYWSLSAYLKLRVKSAVNFIGEFEHALAEEAKRRGVDGVVCGHIHHAADRPIEGVRYLNCGDWVESCTALAEDMNGRIHLIRWHEAMAARAPLAMPQRAPERAPAAFPDLGQDWDEAAALPAPPEPRDSHIRAS